MNDEFATKHIKQAENLARKLARQYKVPDVEEFEAIALYELGISCTQTDNPSWAVVVLRICERLKREADKYHTEKKDRAEYGHHLGSPGR